ncbi:MAG TPA: matrixin family metalloprotease [Candidatus Limnocylindria bacterium]|nr:matrixin family metalloprotease [Candidatus Limnocylindria bacterium]
MIRRIFSLLATLYLLACTAHAFTREQYSDGVQLGWNLTTYDHTTPASPDQNPVTLAIRYRLGIEGSGHNNASNELNSVRSALAQWAAIPGTKIRFEEAGYVTNATQFDPYDGQSQLIWLPFGRTVYGGSVYGNVFLPGGAYALTFLGSWNNGVITEADIVFNGSANTFYQTDFNSTAQSGPFLESVALHEIGHLLGFNHAVLGGATMYWTQPAKVGSAAGLSADDVAAARTLYGVTSSNALYGTITGHITTGGAPVFGAVVSAEDANGNMAQAVVTDATGLFTLKMLVPGNYTVRVTPLDSKTNPNQSTDTYLISGYDIDVTGANFYGTANTSFLPVSTTTLAVVAGGTVSQELSVTSTAPPFRITSTRGTLLPGALQDSRFCIQLSPGQTGAWVGVFTPGLTTTNAVLKITGAGLSVGPTHVNLNGLRGMPLVEAEVAVAADAIPGLRSISVTASGATAWANGFLEVKPTAPDFNFDGLDDLYQRQYFSPFTRTEAAPASDPDGDGLTNAREYFYGTNPLDPSYRILSVSLNGSGTTVTWRSGPGHKYQVWSQEDIAGAAWVKVGSPVTAVAEAASFLDTRPATAIRFYKVTDAP